MSAQMRSAAGTYVTSLSADRLLAPMEFLEAQANAVGHSLKESRHTVYNTVEHRRSDATL